MKHTLFLIFLFVSVNGIPQETRSHAEKTHYVGGHFGPTTGIGFSYRFFKNKTGFQVTALGYKNATYIDLNLGLSLIHKLVSEGSFDFICYAGSRVSYKEENTLSYNYEKEDIQINTPKEFRTNISIGLGIQKGIGNRLKISFQIGYALFNINGQRAIFRKNKLQQFLDHPDNPWTMATGEIGLYYRINTIK